MSLLFVAADVIVSYGITQWSCNGTTPEEIWDSLQIYLTTDEKQDKIKPPKDEFIEKMESLIPDKFLKKLRKTRNKLLEESDWTQMKDVHLSNAEDWATYRQLLRDLPNTNLTPSLTKNIEDYFPKKPN